MCFKKIMLNFKIRQCDRFFASKFSSKWLKIEKSKQVRVFFKNHAQQIKQANQIKQTKQATLNQASTAKQTKQCKQAKQSKTSN